MNPKRGLNRCSAPEESLAENELTGDRLKAVQQHAGGHKAKRGGERLGGFKRKLPTSESACAPDLSTEHFALGSDGVGGGEHLIMPHHEGAVGLRPPHPSAISAISLPSEGTGARAAGGGLPIAPTTPLVTSLATPASPAGGRPRRERKAPRRPLDDESDYHPQAAQLTGWAHVGSRAPTAGAAPSAGMGGQGRYGEGMGGLRGRAALLSRAPTEDVSAFGLPPAALALGGGVASSVSLDAFGDDDYDDDDDDDDEEEDGDADIPIGVRCRLRHTPTPISRPSPVALANTPPPSPPVPTLRPPQRAPLPPSPPHRWPPTAGQSACQSSV